MAGRQASDRRVRRRWERVALATFVATLWVPLLFLAAGSNDPAATGENRSLAPFPAPPTTAIDVARYPARFTRYFEDHFATRSSLIRANAWLHVRLLGVSPDTSVVLGHEGWLYYRGDGALEVSGADRSRSQRDLGAWVRVLEARRAWLAARGIRYIVLVAPEKSSIYPQHLPEHLRPDSAPTRLDHLVEELRARSSVVIVDPRAELRRASAARRVYHRTDTHWNDVGAWIAYRALFDASGLAADGERPVDSTAFRVVERPSAGGDLARMLALPDVLEEEEIAIDPRRPLRLPRERVLAHGRRPLAVEGGRDARPRLVMFRDSFGSALIPFLNEHYSAAVYLWQYDFDRSVVVAASPDVVVEELAERRLMRPAPLE